MVHEIVSGGLLPTKSVEITYEDGTVERFNCEGEPGMSQFGCYVFQRMHPLPPILVNHAKVRKIVPSTSSIQ